jgi:hypothetical protein
MKTVKGNLMKRSNAFIVKLDKENFDHCELYHEMRLITFMFNKQNNTSFKIERVGRLGKNNPNAIKYKNNVYNRYAKYGKIRVDDAAHYDIYLYNRNVDYRSYKCENELKLNSMLKNWASKSLSYNSL